MKVYETTYIIDPAAGEEAIPAIVEKFSQHVQNGGGQVINIDNWGRRKMAYEIKGKKEGIYVTMRFSGPHELAQDLGRVLRISEEVVRNIVIKIN